MVGQKKYKANLKLMYRKALELGFIGALFLVLLMFRAIPELSMAPGEVKAKSIEIIVKDIPPTEQIKKAPPPPRPSIPIPSESEDIPEDLTIESTELDLSDIPPPPGPPADMESGYQFIPYDEPPQPIGGYAAIQKNLKYPELARRAGIETSVILGALIDERGNVVKTQILSGAGSKMGFEKAAQDAVMLVKWKPAMQRDRAVKVWIAIPIRFSLRAESNT